MVGYTVGNIHSRILATLCQKNNFYSLTQSDIYTLVEKVVMIDKLFSFRIPQ